MAHFGPDSQNALFLYPCQMTMQYIMQINQANHCLFCHNELKVLNGDETGDSFTDTAQIISLLGIYSKANHQVREVWLCSYNGR